MMKSILNDLLQFLMRIIIRAALCYRFDRFLHTYSFQEQLFGFCYPIIETKCIDYFYKVKLGKIKINTTLELLKRCRTSAEIEKLAKITGISKTLIGKWVKKADLVRIKGIGEEYADVLVEIGVDTIVKFTRRKPNDLYKKIKEHIKKTRRVKRTPSLGQIKKWISETKGLKKILG